MIEYGSVWLLVDVVYFRNAKTRPNGEPNEKKFETLKSKWSLRNDVIEPLECENVDIFSCSISMRFFMYSSVFEWSRLSLSPGWLNCVANWDFSRLDFVSGVAGKLWDVSVFFKETCPERLSPIQFDAHSASYAIKEPLLSPIKTTSKTNFAINSGLGCPKCSVKG